MEHISLLLVKIKEQILKNKRILIYVFWVIINAFVLFALGYYLVNRLTGEIVFQVNSIKVQGTNFVPHKGYVSNNLVVGLTLTNGTNRDLPISYKDFQVQGRNTYYPTTLEVDGNPTDSFILDKGDRIQVSAVYEPFDAKVKSKFIIPAIYNAPTISMDVETK